jgi:hypothetical protein
LVAPDLGYILTLSGRLLELKEQKILLIYIYYADVMVIRKKNFIGIIYLCDSGCSDVAIWQQPAIRGKNDVKFIVSFLLNKSITIHYFHLLMKCKQEKPINMHGQKKYSHRKTRKIRSTEHIQERNLSSVIRYEAIVFVIHTKTYFAF